MDTGEYAGTITSILPEGAGTAPGAQGLAFIRRAAGGADLRVRVRANDDDGESCEYAGIMGRVTDTPFATRTLTEAAGPPPDVGGGDGGVLDGAEPEAAEPAADAAAAAWAARNKAKLEKKKAKAKEA